ncbi:MAG: dihydrolipoyl dehydrogenase [Thermoproteota archaeon]|nr:dihydrolipoyl dehydrogenase [Thermoproteota archaeon]
MQKFDLIVIGSGSGLDVAKAIAHHGHKVAIVERTKMGGTCLNRGCIPSKLLLLSADVAETIKKAHIFGINPNGFSIDFRKIVESVNTIIDNDSDRIKNAFKGLDNPKLFSTECKFIGVKTLSCGSNKEELTAEKILIAAGSRPKIPDIKGLNNTNYLTSNEALRLKKQPKVLTIIGGGYIACELAHFFGSLGTEIHIVQHKERLIPSEDQDVSKKITELYSKKYNLHLDCTAQSVLRKDSMYHIKTRNLFGNVIEIVSDQLLIAAGRTPNSDSLDLEKTGVKTNDKGYITTDDYLETNVKGIFALGDVIGRYQFKHSANLEAQYAYHNILNQNKKIAVDYTAMPHAIFCSPQVAGVGFTEQELNRMKVKYKKSYYRYINTAMGKAILDEEGFVKFMINAKNKEILGCHMLGSEASILIHEVIPIMRNGNGTIDKIVNSIHVHPALSEVVAKAAFELM